MTDLEFTSDKFLPCLPEDCQANPGVYGFELALWLSQALARAGLFTSYPMGEDWGWFIEYIEGEAEVMIGCGSQCEAGDGYRGQPVMWHVFIKQRRSLKQWIKRQPAESAIAAKLMANIVALLRSEGIDVNSGDAS
ncbi:hypothetical protein [Allochromatium palmeri]|uniref:Uncharacterized protein n=1 Tax=Allochromatium palmeri TaxID=231048 RepID=A0A6N8EH64_9GAMM|nr:hypothetical protein [Allochromatium palmeri]MTW22950.1 hypothetical protein [Allochromatium palmeri]